MAEVLKKVVVEDQAAKRQYINAAPITNEWWYSYRNIDKGTKETAVIIPSDELINFNRSVYNSVISGDIKFDDNGNMVQYPKRYLKHLGTEADMSYFIQYMKGHISEYMSVIKDGYELIQKFMKGIGVESKEISDKLANKLFSKYGFVKVYSILKPDEDDINNRAASVAPNDTVMFLMDQYPQFKDKLSDAIVVSIADCIKIDNTGELAFDGDADKVITEIVTSTLKEAGITPNTIIPVATPPSPVANPASSAAASVNLVKPLPAAPVDKEPVLTRAFVPDGAGNVTINLTNLVNDGVSVDTPPVDVAPEPTIAVAPQPTEVVEPPKAAAQPANQVQPQVKTKKDKGDLKDVEPPKPVTPLGVTPMTDRQKAEFLSHNPALMVIENKLGDTFVSKYRIDSNFVYIDIYAVDNPDTKVDWMSMTVDLSGHVFGPGPKFWIGSDNKEPVDFKPAFNITEEAISNCWSGEGNIQPQDYYATPQTAELNKRVDIASVIKAVNDAGGDPNTIPETIKSISKMLDATKLKNKLKDGRLRMTAYEGPSKFKMAPMTDVPKHVGGPMANGNIAMFTVSCDNGGKCTIV